MTNLFDKEKYAIHYENLQLYLRLELKLKKIRPELEFNQSQWLKPYIEFKSQKQQKEEKIRKDTAQKMKHFVNDFFNKCDQTRRKLPIGSH